MTRPAKLLVFFPSLAALAAAEILLRLVPLKRLLARRGLRLPPALAGSLSRGVNAVDERFPLWRPSCLRRAVALRLLLGAGAPVRLGVKRLPGGTLAAHAWVDAGDAEGFTELAAL